MFILMEIWQFVWVCDDLVIIVGKLIMYLVDDIILLVVFELCDDLNYVVFMKVQVCFVIGFIVVQSVYIYDVRWCCVYCVIYDGGVRGLGDVVEVVEV